MIAIAGPRPAIRALDRRPRDRVAPRPISVVDQLARSCRAPRPRRRASCPSRDRPRCTGPSSTSAWTSSLRQLARLGDLRDPLVPQASRAARRCICAAGSLGPVSVNCSGALLYSAIFSNCGAHAELIERAAEVDRACPPCRRGARRRPGRRRSCRRRSRRSSRGPVPETMYANTFLPARLHREDLVAQLLRASPSRRSTPSNVTTSALRGADRARSRAAARRATSARAAPIAPRQLDALDVIGRAEHRRRADASTCAATSWPPSRWSPPVSSRSPVPSVVDAGAAERQLERRASRAASRPSVLDAARSASRRARGARAVSTPACTYTPRATPRGQPRPAIEVAAGLADPAAERELERVGAERADDGLELVAALHRRARRSAPVARSRSAAPIARWLPHRVDSPRSNVSRAVEHAVVEEVVPRDAEARAACRARVASASVKRNGSPGSGVELARATGRSHSRPRPNAEPRQQPAADRGAPRTRRSPRPRWSRHRRPRRRARARARCRAASASPPGLSATARASCSPASGASGSARPAVGSSA